MLKLIKYLVVSPDNGRWSWNKEKEHHSIAVPKMLNHLELRINNLLKSVNRSILKGMLTSVYNRDKVSNKIYRKIEDTKEELKVHFFMLADFRKKVLDNINNEREGSPLMTLKGMDSPLRKKKTTIAHIYERIENSEAEPRLNQAQENLNKTLETLSIIKQSWKEILDMSDEIYPNRLLISMKQTRENLNRINKDSQEAFFALDDVSQGLIRKGIHLKFNLSDVLNKFTDLLLRSLLKGSLNYPKSEESEMVDKVIFRLKELGLYEMEDLNIKTLLDVKILLETEPVKNTSLKVCYRKIGELHTSMHSKIFAFQGFKYLRKYFSKELLFTMDVTVDELDRIHKKFLDKLGEERRELEIQVKVIEELMMDAEPGKEYFSLNDKLYKTNNLISSKYNTFDEDDLYHCLLLIGSPEFIQFINLWETCIFELRKELSRSQIADIEDLEKVGISTGKTTMINTYQRAIDEILASMGTFIANSLTVLIREMLQQIPKELFFFREGLEKTYIRCQKALDNLDSQ